MAFLSKIGNILRWTANKHIRSELSPLKLSIHQAVRCMSNKLFIGGISYQTDEQSLKEAFAKYGEVIDARIISDRETGRSRGFGFITFTNSEEASSAIQALDGHELHGCRVRVNYATDRPRPNFDEGGGFEITSIWVLLAVLVVLMTLLAVLTTALAVVELNWERTKVVSAWMIP
ncbi:PREDICTED: glycine-rich [Prunus dulcis]|uniref:PREDICTED: glycine-rich n=1 Tax=Prunus dulcis TaxID=3755 RepID=A0A5E4G4Y4_PRUDU|nr:hypothetical protein L3X38_003774 [Prunus dulcis]VVA34723.1 PREDICTED: glycine-rich [Prunus dulcis]